MANQLTRTCKDTSWIGQQGATIEAEVYVATIGYDVAKAVL